MTTRPGRIPVANDSEIGEMQRSVSLMFDDDAEVSRFLSFLKTRDLIQTLKTERNWNDRDGGRDWIDSADLVFYDTRMKTGFSRSADLFAPLMTDFPAAVKPNALMRPSKNIATGDKGVPRGLPWYIAEVMGDAWPTSDSSGVRVAVIDAGIDDTHPAFIGKNIIRGPREPLSPGDHGTQVAGVIGGREVGDLRFGVAPDCTLLDWQRKTENVVPADEVILAMSWAASSGAQVINLSAGGDRSANLEPIAHAAKQLREGNFALLFCATGSLQSGLMGPAHLHEVCAVDGFLPSHDRTGPIMARAPNEFVDGDDRHPRYFLAPMRKLLTSQPNGEVHDDFHQTSAACAFASGVAALYVKKFGSAGLARVLQEMAANPLPLNNRGGTRRLGALAFP